MPIYLAINIHRGNLKMTKGFHHKVDRDIFAERWAQEEGFEDYDAYEKEDYIVEMDNCLYLDETEIR